MPNITNKRTGELLVKVVEILLKEEGGLPSKEIFKRVEGNSQLTEYERGYYKSSHSTPRYAYIIRFATIGMVKGGWLEKNKGVWQLTDEGKASLIKFKDPEKYYLEANRLYKEWKKNRPHEDSIDTILEEDAPVSTTITFEEAEEKAWDQIQDHLKSLDPYDFQKIVADLFEAMGYHVNWIAPRGPDKGIDIIAYSDPLGTKTPRIKVQVKHKIDQSIDVGEMRSFFAVLGNDEVGIYVSSGGFTKIAEEEARTKESKKITLINLGKFFELWIEHYSKLSYEARARLPLKPIYYLSPDE